MSILSHCWVVILLGSLLWSTAKAADRPAKPTHILHPVMLEVAPTRINGNPWDTGIGDFARPDPQVTLMRQDAKALQEATDLMVQATERKMKELGQPIPPRLKEQFANSAMLSLRCGTAIEVLQDQPLKVARSRFTADTSVASNSLLAKLIDGSLEVSSGDKVSIFVNDIDLASHDLMGQAELEITKALLSKGEVELKFNSVESLRLKLAPIGK